VDLVALKPACPVTGHTLSVLALVQAPDSIPIVFDVVTDPVGSGIIAS
jgi:ABC-type uncharacterized transport system substrate-binding protein